MKVMRMSGLLGYIIASLIVIPISVFIYNKYYIKKNSESGKIVKPYINNTIDISFKMPKNELIIGGKDPYNWELITTQFSSKNNGVNGSRRSNYFYQDIYSNNDKKYIRIAMFDISNLFWFDIGDTKVILKVNKDDFNNSYYGTKEHPLICFSVRGTNDPILVDGRGTANVGQIINKDTDKEQEEYNAYMYFTYVMSRKEFKERFKEEMK